MTKFDVVLAGVADDLDFRRSFHHRLHYPSTCRLLRTQNAQDYRIRVTPALHETFNAREGRNDDLVLSVAIAVWSGVRNRQQPSFAPSVVRGTRLADGSCPFAGVAAAGYCGSGGRPWFPAGRVAKPVQGEARPGGPPVAI
jgi:hypothetical protein